MLYELESLDTWSVYFWIGDGSLSRESKTAFGSSYYEHFSVCSYLRHDQTNLIGIRKSQA